MIEPKLLLGDCLEVMRSLPAESVDLVVTSPPYDDLRQYNGYSFDYKKTIEALYKVIKPGGVVVWIVADKHSKKGETGSSFRQALYFQKVGFCIHDTMIWTKPSFSDVGSLQVRYAQTFEYMFILSKGKPSTFNPLKDKVNKSYGRLNTGTHRQKDGSTKKSSCIGVPIQKYGQRYNVWEVTPTICTYGHPATFPLSLAVDHILTWSKEADMVLDPFMGSGTTAVASIKTKRRYIGCDISKDYIDIAKKKIKNIQLQLFSGVS